jgi:SAM-dependent methyltransferase
MTNLATPLEAPETIAASFVEIDGFRCYAPDVALACADYPTEGFDVTAGIEASSFWCRSRNRILRQTLARFTDRSRPLDMLEIGCGIGGVVNELRLLPNLHLTASEIYLQGLRYARARLPDVDFIQLDATDIPFRRAFDIVGAFDVLEHIENDDRVIACVHEALRPGGLFIVTVPQYQWMWSSLDEIVRHKRRYGRPELLRKFRRSDFEVLYCSSFVTALFPAMATTRLLARVRTPPSDTPPSDTEETKKAFGSQVILPPALNRLCDWIMRIDELALRAGVVLPFGGSLLVVGRKPWR